MKINSRFVMGLMACGALAMAQSSTTSGQSTPSQSGSTRSGQTGTTRSGQSGTTPSTTTQEERSGAQSGSQRSTTKGTANRMTGDSNFIMRAAEGSMAEVELGKLATEKASNQAVKDFGQRMVDDHGRALSEVQKMASDKGVTLSEKLNAKHEAMKDRLSKLSGAEFDRAYMRDMVSDHREDVKEFEQHSKTGTDPDAKAFAAKTLPILQEHLKMAESTQSQLGGSRQGMSNREEKSTGSEGKK